METFFLVLSDCIIPLTVFSCFWLLTRVFTSFVNCCYSAKKYEDLQKKNEEYKIRLDCYEKKL